MKQIKLFMACAALVGTFLAANAHLPSQALPSIASAQASEQSLKVQTLKWDDLLPEGTSTVIPYDAASDFPDVMASPFDKHEMAPNPFAQDDPFASNGMSSETGGAPKFDIGGGYGQRPGAPRADLAGKRIALAGYMTPLAVENNKTRSFLLVPYVGACIHVPAPPPNQIVLVESAEPVDVREMWTPFVVVGSLSVESIDTGLAEVGYTLTLERIEKYEEPDKG